MSIPAAAYDQDAHLERMKVIQERLIAEYAELPKTAPPPKPMPAIERAVMRIQQQRRRRANLRDIDRTEDGPRYRFVHPPRRNRQTQVARLFALVFLLHVIVISGIVIADLTESSVMWKAAGGAVIIWMIFRGMAALSRRITPPRRTTSRVTDRNCDRDIFL